METFKALDTTNTVEENLFGLKTLKNVQLDKNLKLKVVENKHSERIFVEFSDTSGRMVVQKSFQNDNSGNADMAKFENSIKSDKDFAKYLGLKGKK